MHRRARHLNPGNAGASIYVDARRIQGVSSGSSVQTWTDNSGSANDLTQSTSSYRPVYNTNRINGQPAVTFTNTSAHYLKKTSYTVTSNAVTVFVVSKTAATPSNYGRLVSINKDSAYDFNTTSGWAVLFYYHDSSYPSDYNRFGSSRNLSTAKSDVCVEETPYVTSVSLNGTDISMAVDGSLFTATTSATSLDSNTFVVGTHEPELSVASLVNYNGDISYVAFAKSVFSNALRNRIEHSMAYSFKIKYK